MSVCLPSMECIKIFYLNIQIFGSTAHLEEQRSSDTPLTKCFLSYLEKSSLDSQDAKRESQESTSPVFKW